MKTGASLKRGLSKVWHARRAGQYDLALEEVNRLLEERPDSSQLLVLRAELTQLQEDEHGTPTLDDAKKDLEHAVALDDRSPAALIELGAYLLSVEDDAKAASKQFQKAIILCRSLLKDALLGQAEALSELEQGDAARDCLVEAYALAAANGKSDRETIFLRLKQVNRSN